VKKSVLVHDSPPHPVQYKCRSGIFQNHEYLTESENKTKNNLLVNQGFRRDIFYEKTGAKKSYDIGPLRNIDMWKLFIGCIQ
jgi:hypothetical protein